jgi:hypothetical protein
MTIVTYAHRPKRARKRKTQPADMPVIVRACKHVEVASDVPSPPANDGRKSAIVTIKRKSGRFGDVPDVTPEEHKRRGDAADALFREMKSQIAEELREK